MSEDKAPLTLNEYQRLARETAFYPGRDSIQGMLYTALGVGGESGEACSGTSPSSPPKPA